MRTISAAMRGAAIEVPGEGDVSLDFWFWFLGGTLRGKRRRKGTVACGAERSEIDEVEVQLIERHVLALGDQIKRR